MFGLAGIDHLDAPVRSSTSILFHSTFSSSQTTERSAMRNVISSAVVSLLSVALVAQPPLSYGADNPSVTSDHSIHDGTPIKLRLRENVSSGNARTGQEVPFETVDEVQVDGVTVLPKGSTAIAVVTEAESKRSMGRAGKLNMAISYARLKNGDKVALRAVSEQKGGSHTGAMTGAMVATSLIVWPAAPFFLFMKGKDIAIPQGTEITAFVDGDMHLDMWKFGVPDVGGAAAGQTSLSVDSTPAGADIEVDGNFVGSTPSAVPVSLGNHEITVRKRGYSTWNRHMNVAGGTYHLNAELERGR
jgi:hypothetical protein